MSKSYKLKDGNYIDSTGIVHNKKSLHSILSQLNNIYTGTITSTKFEINNQRLQKINGVVSFYLDMTCIEAVTSGWTQAYAQFPAGFRAPQYTLFCCGIGSQSSENFKHNVLLCATSANGVLNGDFKFAVGDKIQISGTFIVN